MKICRSLRLQLIAVLAILTAGAAHAGTCSNPAGKEADIVYNGAYHTYQFCNGTNWIPYKFGYAWAAQANNNPSYPTGVGFFVLSHNTYTGNLGGLSGADTDCLSDLTTNTGWKGYSTANSRGQLVSSKVHAFLCTSGSSCNNLNASTAYYFANAANTSAGGASFTTDSSGLGPYNSAVWSAANYFSGQYHYWTERGGQGCSTGNWSSTGADGSCSGQINNTCSGFTNGGSSYSSTVGQSADGGSLRYSAYGIACNNAEHLICFVNP